MLTIRRALASELEHMRVRIEVPDEDTVLLRRVPTDQRCFNKRSTNLLVKRPGRGLPFLVCVDEDLEYVGTDAARSRAFQKGPRRDGWRVLLTERGPVADMDTAVEQGLHAVGAGIEEGRSAPSPAGTPSAEPGRFLERLGRNLSVDAESAAVEPTVGRESEMEETVSCLLRWGAARMAVIVGEPGVGKSNLLWGVARRIRQFRPAHQLMCVDLAPLLAGVLFEAERETILMTLLKEAAQKPQLILALEHLDLLALQSPREPLLLAEALDGGLAIAGTMLPGHLAGMKASPLERRSHAVVLCEPGMAETVQILAQFKDRMAEHHHVTIEAGLVNLAVRMAQPLRGHFPAKAIELLDEAASNATLLESAFVSPDDLYSAASRLERRP